MRRTAWRSTTARTTRASSGRGPGPASGGRGLLAFDLQSRFVLFDELADLVGHVEQLGPLLLVERHREAAQTVYRNASLLTDLESCGAAARTFQPLVFGLQTLELGFQVLVGHVTLL